jgi:uncharacterized YceG family protein
MAQKKRWLKKKPFIIAAIGLLIIVGLIYTYSIIRGLRFSDTLQALNPTSRTIVIYPGLRKEQVAHTFGKALNWTSKQEDEFIAIHTKAYNGESEGYYFPGTYVVSSQAKPAEISILMQNKFKERILSKFDALKTNAVSLDTVMKIASIIEREAGNDSDKKIISGVIWNRLFRGMNLEMDATLQYAKATSSNNWWPRVISSDKKIDSPYNSYKFASLPPTPISSPSETAIWAALNPPKSNTLFYVHDAYGQIYTASTYQEHLANIHRAFGY